MGNRLTEEERLEAVRLVESIYSRQFAGCHCQLERKLVNNISRIPELFEILGVSSRQLLIILDSSDLKKAVKDEAPHIPLTGSEKLV
jgi:hypothetical protein